MVDISRAQPHALRISVVALCLVALILFFDPVGFAPGTANLAHVPGTTRTVTHIVLFRFKQGADAAAIDEACAKFLALKDSCLAPNSQQPYIRRISGGKDSSNEGLQDGMTHAFVVHFESSDDRNYYVEQDPVHQAFKKEVDPLLEKVTVLDFTNGRF